MQEYVEFSGKDVDDAIANACTHFGIERDKLEVEIISGGSSGIFGLVGVKKARIMARKMAVVTEEQPDISPSQKKQAESKEPAPGKKPAREKAPPRQEVKVQQKSEPVQKPDHEHREESAAFTKQKAEPEFPTKPETRTDKIAQTDGRDKSEADNNIQDSRPADPELKKYIHGLMVSLTEPLSPGAGITINDQTRPISVTIKDETASEILIGRDGQTLSAIQYIANRIIAKNRPGAARVQLDTEDFLEKQNEKLQQNAFQLASKAKKIGKTMSTRPLSSYHRRIVHMALQNDKKIRTKSKGDGPMKRVLIMPKQRRKKSSQD